MKERITVTIDAELLNYLDDNIKNKVYANRSHALEFLIFNSKTKEDSSG